MFNYFFFFFSFISYDAHIIMQKIGLNKEEDIKCIPANSETYISFSQGELRFLDTMRFIPASLQTHVEN